MDITAETPPRPSIEMLAQLPLFEGERREVLDWLAPQCWLEYRSRGAVLLHPLRQEDRAYVILEGEVQVQLQLGGPADPVLATLGPGQCVGEMSVIDSVPPSAVVTTGTACELLVIEGRLLRSLLETSGTVPRNLLRMLARRVRQDNQILRRSLEQQAASAQHARIDALTGLYNRRWLDEILPSLIAGHQLQGQPLVLLMIDIDHFKTFNDSHGHLAGDQALVGVAQILQSQIRSEDRAARFGGEEFLVILPATRTAEAYRIATRLRRAVEHATLQGRDGLPLPGVTISLGLAQAESGESAESLLARADAALYRAKQQGRNRLVVGVRGVDAPEPLRITRIPQLRREPPPA